MMHLYRFLRSDNFFAGGQIFCKARNAVFVRILSVFGIFL